MKAIKRLFLIPLLGLSLASCIVTGELGDTSQSTPAAVAATAPNGATSLTWVEGNTYDTNNLNVTWTPSSSTGVTAQTLNFYASEDCSGAAIAAAPAITLLDSTYNWTGVAADLTGYTFSITSTNAVGSTITCSNPAAADLDYLDAGEIYIDSTDINLATIGAISWWGADTSPHTADLSITASWTPSNAGSATDQEIYIYTETAPHANPVTVDCTLGGHTTTLSLGSTVANAYTIAAASGTAYAFRIRTRAGAPDNFYSACSTAMITDTTNPTAPTALGWVQASPSGATPVTATWTLGSADIIEQVIKYYPATACGGAEVLAQRETIADGATSTDAFTAPASGTYSYEITVTDSAGLTSTSACSADMVYDNTAPLSASGLLWSLASPTNVDTVAAFWTINAGDVDSQEIIYYDDSTTCATAGTIVVLGSAINSYTPGGGFPDATYSFKVITYDAVNNDTSSPCSGTTMTVDTVAPTAPTNTDLTWTESSPANGTSLSANWIVIANTDYYTAGLYSDGTCTTPGVGTPISSSNTTSTSTILTGTVDASIHSFGLIAKDYAGNSSVEVCMAAGGVVTSDQTAPTVASWGGTGAPQWNADADYPVHYGPSNITATWVDNSGDETAFNIYIYSDATCSTLFSPDISTSVGVNVVSYAFAGTNGTTYYYKTGAPDTAGNESLTVCSEGITYLDTEIALTDASVVNDDKFGQSVAIYGTTVVVGSPNYDLDSGAISIFTKDGVNWGTPARINGRDALGCNTTDNDHFGATIAIDINTIIVGVPDDSSGGAACIYTKTGSTWSFAQRITASDNAAGDGFGTSVDISGAFAIIGAPYWDGASNTNDGAAYVFYYGGSSWSEDDILSSGDPNDNDNFGFSVAIDAITAVVGAPSYDGGGTDKGTIYIFEYSGTWSEEVQYPSGVIADSSNFGYDVDVDGTRVLVGAAGAGEAYAYDKAAVWDSSHADVAIAAAKVGTGYGSSVSLYSNYALIGAPNTAGGGTNRGAAYLYDNVWAETAITQGTPVDNNYFGTGVGLFGTTSVVGAPQTVADTGEAYIEL